MAPAELRRELKAFSQKWRLDDAAEEWLATLPHEVSAILVEQFQPREDTQNVIGKLRGFARSIQARFPGSGLEPLAEVSARWWERASSDSLANFITRWGVDDSATSLMRSLPVDIQAIVMEEFDPKGDVVNISGKLCAFARSIAAKRRSQDAVDTFASQWGLDEASKQFLRGLPEDVLATVVHQFEPKPGTRDIAGKLRMFAKGVLNGAPVSQRHFVEVTMPAGNLDFGQHVDVQLASSSDPAIHEFVQQWGLDSSSVEFLESLPSDARATVLGEFEPRANTRDISGKLRVFANTVLHGQGRGAARTVAAHLQATSSTRPASTPREPEDLSEAEFLDKWGLAGNQTALDVLHRLHPPVRLRVMREFAPGQDTRDTFGKFCGFAASVARAAVKGGILPSPSFTPAEARGTITRKLPASTSGRMSTFNAFAPKGARRSGMAPELFADRWQLDEGSRALLRGLDPLVQATVMVEFQPRDDVRDPSGKFCAFARSVATRLSDKTRSQKRATSTEAFRDSKRRPRL